MHALWLSFGVIFVAELGDKSQLMALAFSARYRALPVLVAITIATALVHAFSVGLGALLSVAIPTRPITIIAGIAFLVFGVWTLRGDELSEDEENKSRRMGRSALIAVGSAFFLAELGDKTMLATITLATNEGALGTWVGSTLGMVAADALAIGAGKMMGARLPERAIAIGASVLFFAFGALLIIEGVRS